MTASAAVPAEQLHLKQAMQAFRDNSANSTPGQVLDLLRVVASQIDARLAEASAAVDELAEKSADLNTRVANAVARRDILSMSKFIEHVRKWLCAAFKWLLSICLANAGSERQRSTADHFLGCLRSV